MNRSSLLSNRRLWSVSLVAGALLATSQARAQHDASNVFLVKPYLQLGDSPSLGETETFALVWQTDTATANWLVELRQGATGRWVEQPTFYGRVVNVPGTPEVKGLPPHRIYE